jgi:ketosteroid isomerase-like protein
MSQENVKLVHQTVDAFNRRDLDAFLALMDPGVEFTPYVVVVEGGYQGHDGVRRWWQDLFEVFPDWHVEPMEVRDLGNLTLATLRLGGHGGESGTPVNQMLWQLAEWSIHSKVVRVSHHSNEAEALEAAGLRE